jgi:hypothetical protein
LRTGGYFFIFYFWSLAIKRNQIYFQIFFFKKKSQENYSETLGINPKKFNIITIIFKLPYYKPIPQFIKLLQLPKKKKKKKKLHVCKILEAVNSIVIVFIDFVCLKEEPFTTKIYKKK